MKVAAIWLIEAGTIFVDPEYMQSNQVGFRPEWHQHGGRVVLSGWDLAEFLSYYGKKADRRFSHFDQATGDPVEKNVRDQNIALEREITTIGLGDDGGYANWGVVKRLEVLDHRPGFLQFVAGFSGGAEGESQVVVYSGNYVLWSAP